MKSIIKSSKRGIIAILTLCMLLGVAGTCLNVAAMAETTVTVEETMVVTEASAIATEETTAITEEIAPELMPMMASRCYSGDQYSDRYFDTLDDAKKVYGYDLQYIELDNPVYVEPGCYGGYSSNGGTYTYYYSFSNGDRVYLHVGV